MTDVAEGHLGRERLAVKDHRLGDGIVVINIHYMRKRKRIYLATEIIGKGLTYIRHFDNHEAMREYTPQLC